MDLETLQQKYPRPITYEEAVKTLGAFNPARGYCVGGSLCLSLGYSTGFPALETLALALTEVNPAFGQNRNMALDFAGRIIRRSDAGLFERAWKTLGEAMAWGPDF